VILWYNKLALPVLGYYDLGIKISVLSTSLVLRLGRKADDTYPKE